MRRNLAKCSGIIVRAIMGNTRNALPLPSEFTVPRQRLFFFVLMQNVSSRTAVLKWPIFLYFKKAQHSFTFPFSKSLRKKVARKVVSFS